MNQSSDSTPKVFKRFGLPPGTMPRHAQAWFIGVVSLLMVFAISLSGKGSKKTPAPAPDPSVVSAESNREKIQEYTVRIEEQSRKLALAQAQLAQAKESLPPTIQRSPAGSAAMVGEPSFTSGNSGYPAAPRERSWTETEREKREYQSLFASNVALSLREEPKSVKASPLPGSIGIPGEKTDPKAQTVVSEPVRYKGQCYRVFEGTVLETALMNRLDGDFSGPVKCVVTTSLYSRNGQHLLIPQGSQVVGNVRRVEAFGQRRLAVTFDRLIMPDGYDVELDDFEGLNQLGETGLRDRVDNHYAQVFSASLAIGLIAGLSQANTRYGFEASAEDAYRQGVATSLSQSSLRILDRYLNVLPTFTIREGSLVKVYLSGDLLLPAYENHLMPGDL